VGDIHLCSTSETYIYKKVSDDEYEVVGRVDGSIPASRGKIHQQTDFKRLRFAIYSWGADVPVDFPLVWKDLAIGDLHFCQSNRRYLYKKIANDQYQIAGVIHGYGAAEHVGKVHFQLKSQSSKYALYSPQPHGKEPKNNLSDCNYCQGSGEIWLLVNKVPCECIRNESS
jgi:hypothetical protein